MKLHWIDGANGEKGHTAINRERFNNLFLENRVVQVEGGLRHLSAEEIKEFLKKTNNVQENVEGRIGEDNL